MSKVIVSAPAKRDIRDVLAWSLRQFGDLAADRYGALVATAINQLTENSSPVGSRNHAELPEGLRIYHLRNVVDQAELKTGKVKNPRHFIVYRPAADLVEIIRVLHDSMDLQRHV